MFFAKSLQTNLKVASRALNVLQHPELIYLLKLMYYIK